MQQAQGYANGMIPYPSAASPGISGMVPVGVNAPQNSMPGQLALPAALTGLCKASSGSSQSRYCHTSGTTNSCWRVRNCLHASSLVNDRDACP